MCCTMHGMGTLYIATVENRITSQTVEWFLKEASLRYHGTTSSMKRGRPRVEKNVKRFLSAFFS